MKLSVARGCGAIGLCVGLLGQSGKTGLQIGQCDVIALGALQGF
jgi:hypothetical protein